MAFQFGTSSNKPTTGSLFGTLPNTTSSSGGIGAGSSLFGGQTITNTTATSGAASTGGSLFGTQPATNVAPPSAGITTGSSLFGTGTSTPSLISKPVENKTTTATPSLFGATTSITGNTTATTTQPTSITGTTTATETKTFTEFNNILRKQINEFEIMNKQFLADARYINDYDKVLRDNQRKITLANEELTELENEKGKCVNEAEVINVQLKEINDVVSALEKQLGISEIDTMSPDFAKTSDIKRQNLMQTFLGAHAQMQQLEDDISALVREVESVSKLTNKDQTGNDTFEDIQQLLATQMEQLIFVDNQVEQLSKKITEIESKI